MTIEKKDKQKSTYWLLEMYEAKSLEMAYNWPVACRKYLFPSSPNFQYSGSWYLTPLYRCEQWELDYHKI